jgi:outer membrane protein W
LPQGDVSWSVGVSGTDDDRANLYDDWYRTWNGTFSAGYYWTEHLKTELDAAWTSEGRLYETRVLRGGAYAPVEHLFSTRSVTLKQQYQFGHNASFHPHLAIGLAIEWVRYTEKQAAAYLTARTPPYAVFVYPARTVGPITDVRALPVIEAGFKAYFSERVFFRSDLNVGLRGGVRHVTVRSGLGLDF